MANGGKLTTVSLAAGSAMILSMEGGTQFSKFTVSVAELKKSSASGS